MLVSSATLFGISEQPLSNHSLYPTLYWQKGRCALRPKLTWPHWKPRAPRASSGLLRWEPERTATVQGCEKTSQERQQPEDQHHKQQQQEQGEATVVVARTGQAGSGFKYGSEEYQAVASPLSPSGDGRPLSYAEASQSKAPRVPKTLPEVAALVREQFSEGGSCSKEKFEELLRLSGASSEELSKLINFRGREELCVEEALGVLELLGRYGLTLKQLLPMSRKKNLFRNREYLQEMIELFIETGTPDSKIAAVLPEVHGTAVATLRSNIGFLTSNEIYKPFLTRKKSLTLSPMKLQEKFGLLQDLLGPEAAMAAVKSEPRLLCVSTESLKDAAATWQAYFGRDLFLELVGKGPAVLYTSTPRLLKACEILESKLGFTTEDLTKFLARAADSGVPRTGMEENLDLLIDNFGGDRVKHRLLRLPDRVWRVPENTVQVFQWLKGLVTEKEAMEAFKDSLIYRVRVEETCAPIMSVLVNELGLEPADVLSSRIWGLSFKTFKERTTFLKESGYVLVLDSKNPGGRKIPKGGLVSLETVAYSHKKFGQVFPGFQHA